VRLLDVRAWVGEKACADETAVVGEKACADETAVVGEKACADDAVDNIGDPIVDESAELENAVGSANELGDAAIVGADADADVDNFPVELPAPPLLHGSLADHGSMALEFTAVPTEN
jgi:hypothetical protein